MTKIYVKVLLKHKRLSWISVLDLLRVFFFFFLSLYLILDEIETDLLFARHLDSVMIINV